VGESRAIFAEFRIVVFEVLRCDQIMFDGNNNSAKRLNLLFDPVTKHNHVFNGLTGAMAKQYICKVGNKSCELDVTCVNTPVVNAWQVHRLYH
jgi:hypothetical protein